MKYGRKNNKKFLLLNLLLLSSKCGFATEMEIDEKKTLVQQSFSKKNLINAIYKNFDHFKAYEIDKIHKAGFKGEGYKIAFIEESISSSHPALQEKVEIINLFSSSLPEDYKHGNHVAGIMVGKKSSQFSGGVAPEAQAILVMDNGGERLENHYSDLIKKIDRAAQEAHIINISSGLPAKINWDKNLPVEFTQGLKKSLIENDSVLIITASNYPSSISSNNNLKYLVDLVSDPELSERVLIVGNLKYVSLKEMKQQESDIRNWEDILIPDLKNYLEGKKFQPIEKIPQDFNNYLKENASQDIISLWNIPEVKNIFRFSKEQKLKDFKELTNFQKTKMIRKIINDIDQMNKKGTIRKVAEKNFQDSGYTDVKKFTEKLNNFISYLKDLTNDKNYVSREDLTNSLDEYIFETYDQNPQVIKSYENYKKHIFLDDIKNFDQNDTSLKIILKKDKDSIPEIKENSGIIAAASAGEVGEHFVLTYGCDIRSAWKTDNYENQTGSSMAAPITTGIITLLHQYLNENSEHTYSWKDVISYVKAHSKPIGKTEFFGQGMLDTKRLFPRILGEG